MGQMTYEESKSSALKLIILLGVITIVEVLVALIGKGYLGNMEMPIWLMAIIMISLSLYKAYKIIYEFMHLGHEVPGLLKSVLLPTLLLVWAIIAFFLEGSYWKSSREKIKQHNEEQVNKVGNTPVSMNTKEINEISLY